MRSYSTGLCLVLIVALNCGAVSAAEIIGKVIKVTDSTVSIATKPGQTPMPGDTVEVFFIVPGENKESIVATGTVLLTVEDVTVARIDKRIAKINANFGARILSKKAKESSTAPPAPDDEAPGKTRIPAFKFRGAEPGTTSEKQLRAHPKWGKPSSTSTLDDGSQLLEYRIRGYKRVTVLLRGGIVQSIDVALPDGVSPVVAAEAFELGIQAEGELPKAAKVGAKVSNDWQQTRFSAGRVSLFIDRTGTKPIAKVLRFYAESLLSTEARPLLTHKIEVTLKGQDDTSRQIVRKVVELLEKNHYSGRKLDDEISARWMDHFINKLDPQKLSFVQSDIDRFHNMVAGIDDQARQGEIRFAYELFETFVSRRQQALELVRGSLQAKHDFTVDEEFHHANKTTEYPANGLEAREIWRKRIKYEILNRRAKGTDLAEAKRRVSRHFDDAFRVPGRIRDGELLEWCLEALGDSYDSNSGFYSATTYDSMRINMQRQMVGIGAALQVEDGDTYVSSIVPGSPSGLDGRLKARDRIVAVAASADDEFHELRGMSLTDGVQLIRGKAGTVVKLKVLPKDQKQPVVYEITRAKFQLEGARSTIITEKLAGNDKRVSVGYIKLPALYSSYGGKADRTSTSDVQKMLAEFKTKAVDVVLLDMRSNSGGTLNEAITIPGLFLGKVPVTQVRNHAGKVSGYNNVEASVAWAGPLVILTNQYTGSGAEIPVAALQDYRRALVIGDRATNGNASVVSVLDIGKELVKGNNPPRLGSVRVSSQMFYRPNGSTTHGVGVVPDIALPSYTSVSQSIDDKSESLKADRIQPMTYSPIEMVGADLIAELKQLSEQRRRLSPEFQEFQSKLEVYAENQSRTSTTLNEVKFLEKYSKTDDSATAAADKSELLKRDAYVNEVLAIAMDYAQRAKIEWAGHYFGGWQQLESGEHAAALDSASRAIQLDPKRLAAFALRARARAAAGDWDAALADVKTAKLTAIPSYAVQDGTLTIREETIADVTAGTRMRVSRVSDTWLWAETDTNPRHEGWIRKQFVAPTFD